MMSKGKIVGIYIARVKNTPSDTVREAIAVSGKGLVGDRSSIAGNTRQVLVMDKETLDELGLEMGQIKENITTAGLDLSRAKEGKVFSISEKVKLEITAPCKPCSKMDSIRPGLQSQLEGRRGVLATVTDGGAIQIGDTININL